MGLRKSPRRFGFWGAALVLVVLIGALPFVWNHLFPPTGTTHDPKSATRTSSVAEHNTGSEASRLAEASGSQGRSAYRPRSGRDLEQQTQAAIRDLEIAATDTSLQNAQAYWRQEDAVLAKAPRYEDLRDQLRRKAADLLAQESITWEDTSRTAALAQNVLDDYWAKGSLMSPAAYESGYLARAILETALERNPNDFLLLDALREAVDATCPYYFADYRKNHYALDALWPIVEGQKQMLLQGRHPPDLLAFDAMYAWIAVVVGRTRDTRNAITGWKWLLENADKGGWSKVKPDLKMGLANAENGMPTGFNIYIERLGHDALATQSFFAHGRRLFTLRGSKYRRSHSVRYWDSKRPLSTTIKTTGDDK